MPQALRAIATVAKPGDSRAVLRYPKLLALAAGAVSATGFAPLELWPVALACFALLIHLLCTAPNGRGAFARMWLFALGHFTIGLNWIAHAFTYQESMPHWFGYGAVVGLSLYLAVFPALGALAVHTLTRPSRAKSRDALGFGKGEMRASTSLGMDDLMYVLFLAAAWIATEYLRATLFTGFAWNPLAAIWVPVFPARWLTTIIGTYGLSGLTILLAGLLLRAATERQPWLALPLVMLLIPTSAPQPATGTAVRIVQPNVSQDEKHTPGAQIANLKKLARMSGPPGAHPRILMWPEAAIDNGMLLEEEPALRRFLARMLGPRDMLLTGGVALEYDKTGRPIGGRNSVFAMGPDQRVHARYDKAHLVPYGEYLPMREILTPLGLSRLVPGDLDFWPGPGPKSFDIPGMGRVGFQICYEIIFSGQVVEPKHRPLFLFNPSNDAWFGSWGPPQHMAQARLRATEEAMTIVRSTPTGISGVIDPLGRLTATIGLGKLAVLDARLPAISPPTLFARYGNLLSGLLALLLVALGVVIRFRRR